MVTTPRQKSDGYQTPNGMRASSGLRRFNVKIRFLPRGIGTVIHIAVAAAREHRNIVENTPILEIVFAGTSPSGPGLGADAPGAVPSSSAAVSSNRCNIV